MRTDLLAMPRPELEDAGVFQEGTGAFEYALVLKTNHSKRGRVSNVVVVDHLPVVPQEKHEKLTAVLTKIFGQLGNIRENGLHMPSDASNNSKGFAFVEYNTPAEAVNARENANGYRLDKNHVFSVYTFDDLDKFSRVPNEYVPPEAKAYTPTEDLFHWLMDKRGRDQFVSRYADQTEIFWNDAKATGKEELVYQRQHWTESFVQWSPRGTYLATVHRQGAALWGGPNFVRMQRFAHQHLLTHEVGQQRLGLLLREFSAPRRFEAR